MEYVSPLNDYSCSSVSLHIWGIYVNCIWGELIWETFYCPVHSDRGQSTYIFPKQ